MHDDFIKWKHFPRYWPFVRGIDRSLVTLSFDVFSDLRPNKWLSKQSRHQWFEMPLHSLWRHHNMYFFIRTMGSVSLFFWLLPKNFCSSWNRKYLHFDSLAPSDTICNRTWPTLVQVMACFLMAPSHSLNQCWLVISEILWYSPLGDCTGNARDTNN